MSSVYRNATPPTIPWLSEGFFDFWSSRVHPLWTLRRPLARLVARNAASSDAVTLELQPNRHFKGMLAGQHINLGVEVEGRLTTRSYSPTVLPNGHLAITVKAIAGGKISNHLARDAAIGEVFALGQAFGEMTLPADAPQCLLLLAAGSGITPMRALLRQLDAQGMLAPVELRYWARCREELCFVEELNALASRQPNFRLQLLLTRDPNAPNARVDAHDFSDITALKNARVLACGPGGFVEAARQRLQGQVASFQSEAFSQPLLPAQEAGSVQVQLLRSGRTLTVPRGTALLQALEAEGIQPASGCRMGICNTCVCGKVSGITRHTLTGEYADEPSTLLKLCVNSASTDLALEL
ncbi:MAG: ferredoxin reductase [Stenotrophomonas sp.]|uniref:ferredoxin reductase n=1 Tax=Stenotrophomonas sp. TaxID=69392 RepID=UPI003D6D060B